MEVMYFLPLTKGLCKKYNEIYLFRIYLLLMHSTRRVKFQFFSIFFHLKFTTLLVVNGYGDVDVYECGATLKKCIFCI